MTYKSPWVNAVCFLGICGMVLVFPVYAAWVFGGWIADRREKILFQRARESALAPIGHQK